MARRSHSVRIQVKVDIVNAASYKISVNLDNKYDVVDLEMEKLNWQKT